MESDKKQSKGKLIGIIVGIIAFAASFYAAQQLFKKDLESELKQAAAKVNKQLPMQIDELTRLDSTSTKGKTNFIYYYTLFNTERSDVNLDTINKYVKPNIIDNVKTTPDLKTYRDLEITMDYVYFDKDGEFITKISVSPDLYKNEE